MTDLSWLRTGTELDTPVAIVGQQIRTRADLLAAVQHQLDALQHSLAHTRQVPPASDWILWQSDSYTFLVGLLALLAAGRHVILPPNATPALLERLQADGAVLWQAAAEPITSAADAASGQAPSLIIAADARISLYTSGSTGAAKHIPRTLAQLLHEVGVLESVFLEKRSQQLTEQRSQHLRQHDDKHVVLATVSPQHIYGLLFKLLWPLAAGRAFVNKSLDYPEEIIETLMRYPDAVLVTSPALLKRWPDGLAKLTTAATFSSGGALPGAARAAFESHASTPVTEILGSSETGGIAWRRRHGSWTPLPSVELAIADNGGLRVRSPHALPGWNDTGDSASLEAGTLILGPRLDRLVKIEEKRVSLDAVESALRALPLIRDAHVLCLDGKTRQELVAVVVLTDAGNQQLQQLGRASLGRQLHGELTRSVETLARPRRWRFLPALPVNQQGKLAKAELAALFEPASLPNTALPQAEQPASPQRQALPHLPDVLQLNIEAASLLQASLTLQARVPADLSYCAGHFPDVPVVPGVAIIAWVEHFARSQLGVTGQFLKMEQIKFQHIIRPLDEFTLQIDYLREQHRVNFRCYAGARVHASGRLIYLESA